MENTIKFIGFRDSVSPSGNTEWFKFIINSDIKLHEKFVEEIVDAHGCGGQSFSCQEEFVDGVFSYIGKTTRYSD